jgi:dTDP-4-amino-4,6-dideoxygalactose transaminase
VNLVALHARIKAEISEVVLRVVETGAFVGGPDCAAFEREFADYCGVKGAVGCANGTDSLQLILRALEIGPGDEAITARTRAIIPVDLYGHPAPMAEILDLAAQAGLRVIEDAAQSHGATLHGRKAGSFGDAASFSFYPGKNLGAIGDGGMVVSNDLDLLARVRRIANHGSSKDKYRSETLGTNSRLDTIQAGVLRIKLRHLDAWNQIRRERASQYCEQLQDFDRIGLPVETEGARSAWHLFVVQTERRADLMAALAAEKIATGIHYPVPIHRQAAFEAAGPGSSFKVAERLADRIVSLPLCPELREDDLARVVAVIRRTL